MDDSMNTSHNCPYCDAGMSAVIEIVPDMSDTEDTWLCSKCRYTEKIKKTT